ncbi:MAG TPA: hypothetical protein V6C88_12555 [Chroococcidiopsis sp.]
MRMAFRTCPNPQSRIEPRFPCIFFDPALQSMIHGGKPVGLKPTGYFPEVLIQPSSNGE